MPVWAAGLGVVALGLAAASAAWAAEGDHVQLPADKWGKTPLSGTKLTWVQGIVGQASGVLQAGEMPLSVAFGQAAVETGWGGSMRDNPWGKRGAGDKGSQLITTTECYEANKDCVKLTGQKFASYSGEAAAALGLVSFLSGPNYRKGWAWRSADPGRWLIWLWAMGYATANHYPSAVVDASRKIAVSLNDARLAVAPWTAEHSELASKLGAVNAGSSRRALANKLMLGVG